jgi:hypothetical protein
MSKGACVQLVHPFRIRVFIAICLLICLFPVWGSAQVYDTASIFNFPVTLDSFVVKSGFDVQAFIRRVKTDTTFYKATRSMKLVPYTATNDIKVYDKKGGVTASLQSITKQERNMGCRSTKVVQERVTGDFYNRKKEYNYYTAELFAYLFFAERPICGENDIVGRSITEKDKTEGKAKLDNRKYELKLLLFSPGSRIRGIPFMGDRESIFDEGEAEKYDFKIEQALYDTQKCYVFRITPKQGFERKVIYDNLTTWFRKSDYSIIARDYSLSYHTMVYDFDVRMNMRTSQINGKLYPTRIDYDGNWHVFTKKRERVKFSVDITY